MSDSPSTPRQIYAPVADTPAYYAREPAGIHPPLDFPGYKSTALRHPKQPLVYLSQGITEVTGPALSSLAPVGELDNDLTRQHDGEPIGERLGHDVRSSRPVPQPNLFQPLPVSDGGAVGGQMQLRLQIERQKLRPLRLDYRHVLRGDDVLKTAKLFGRNVMSVVQGHDQPDAALALRHRRDR